MDWVSSILASGLVGAAVTFALGYYYKKIVELKAGIVSMDYILAALKAYDQRLDDFIKMAQQVCEIKLKTAGDAEKILGMINRDHTIREFSHNFLDINFDMFKNLTPDFNYYMQYKESLSDLFIRLSNIQMHLNVIISKMEEISIHAKEYLEKKPQDKIKYAEYCLEYYGPGQGILCRCKRLKDRVKEAVILAEEWSNYLYACYKRIPFSEIYI